MSEPIFTPALPLADLPAGTKKVVTLGGVPSANGPITQPYLTTVKATYKAKKDVSAQARKNLRRGGR